MSGNHNGGSERRRSERIKRCQKMLEESENQVHTSEKPESSIGTIDSISGSETMDSMLQKRCPNSPSNYGRKKKSDQRHHPHSVARTDKTEPNCLIPFKISVRRNQYARGIEVVCEILRSLLSGRNLEKWKKVHLKIKVKNFFLKILDKVLVVDNSPNSLQDFFEGSDSLSFLNDYEGETVWNVFKYLLSLANYHFKENNPVSKVPAEELKNTTQDVNIDDNKITERKKVAVIARTNHKCSTDLRKFHVLFSGGSARAIQRIPSRKLQSDVPPPRVSFNLLKLLRIREEGDLVVEFDGLIRLIDFFENDADFECAYTCRLTDRLSKVIECFNSNFNKKAPKNTEKVNSTFEALNMLLETCLFFQKPVPFQVYSQKRKMIVEKLKQLVEAIESQTTPEQLVDYGNGSLNRECDN